MLAVLCGVAEAAWLMAWKGGTVAIIADGASLPSDLLIQLDLPFSDTPRTGLVPPFQKSVGCTHGRNFPDHVGRCRRCSFVHRLYTRGTADEKDRHKLRFFSLSRDLLNLGEQVVLVNVTRQRSTAVSGYETPPTGVVVFQNDAVIQIGSVDMKLIHDFDGADSFADGALQ